MKKLSTVTRLCLFAFAVNFLLFGVKLYIGLAANSITVFSDAVNNGFDSLSGGVSFLGLLLVSRVADRSAAHMLRRTEQLFSLVISVILVFTAAYFAYSSFERLMYPTPVWFTPLHVWMLALTAAVKLFLCFVFRRAHRREPSGILRLLAMDSALDFFITAVSAATLWLSAVGTFRVDAVCGIFLSVLIGAPGVKSVLRNASGLIGYVPAQKREAVNAILADSLPAEAIRSMRYETGEDGAVLLLELAPGAEPPAALLRLREETGIDLQILTGFSGSE